MERQGAIVSAATGAVGVSQTYFDFIPNDIGKLVCLLSFFIGLCTLYKMKQSIKNGKLDNENLSLDKENLKLGKEKLLLEIENLKINREPE